METYYLELNTTKNKLKLDVFNDLYFLYTERENTLYFDFNIKFNTNCNSNKKNLFIEKGESFEIKCGKITYKFCLFNYQQNNRGFHIILLIQKHTNSRISGNYRRQHFLPQSYLKSWAINGKVHVDNNFGYKNYLVREELISSKTFWWEDYLYSTPMYKTFIEEFILKIPDNDFSIILAKIKNKIILNY